MSENHLVLTRCRPRQVDMEAVLVTPGNLSAVAAWAGGQVVADHYGEPEMVLFDERDPHYRAWAKPGFYVLRGCTGRYWAATPELFERDYEVLS